MSDINSYEFSGTPVDNIENVIQFPTSIFPRSYQKILFQDSIFNFYPYGEISLKDEIGIILDKMFFTEGFEWNFKLGSNEQKIIRKGNSEAIGYLNHNYVWSEPLFNAEKITSHFSGIQNFALISSMYMKDDFYTRMYSNKKISAIVTEVLRDYNISSNKQFLSTTSGTDDYPQYNITDKEFLNNLADVSYQVNKSPFFTFFNCKGEFYFMSLIDMFKQVPIGTYSLSESEQATIDDWTIQNYSVLSEGLPLNRKNYKHTTYTLDSNGSITSNIHELKDYYLKQGGKDKFTVRSKTVSGKNNCVNLGIKNASKADLYLGKANALFVNSQLTNQMEIVIRFNPQAVSGKTINIQADRSDGKTRMSELSGNWLITEQQCMCSDQGIPSQKLNIAKSAIQINQNNPFYSEFI
jgi:hypothetical protein